MTQDHKPRRVLTDELIKEMSDSLPADNGAQCEGLCEEIRKLFDEWDTANAQRRQQLMAMIKAVQARRTELKCGECFLT